MGLIIMNGITDASNAVATVVGTKVLTYRKACKIASMFNIVGIFTMYLWNDSITHMMNEMMMLPSGKLGISMLAISSMITIFYSAVSAFYGIPASESYELIFSLIGVCVAFCGFNNSMIGTIRKVIGSLIFAVLGTFFLGKMLEPFMFNIFYLVPKTILQKLQIVSCVGLSFAHGAQDGLKFIGILFGYQTMTNLEMNRWFFVFLCASMMAFGTMIGGKRIVISVGQKLAKQDLVTALSSECCTIILLLLGNFLGMPLSTSHVKTVSCVSVGNEVNFMQFKRILYSWLIVLPVCFLSAFLLAKIIMK